MLARVRKLASPLGHLLDFLMDELKAMLLYGCVTVRLWRQTGDDWLLIVGLAGLFCLASGIALTSFMRRPEYGAKPPTEDGQPAEVGGRRGLVGRAISALEWAARVVVHYPQYIWLCAAGRSHRRLLLGLRRGQPALPGAVDAEDRVPPGSLRAAVGARAA
jgi:hypothetical protein